MEISPRVIQACLERNNLLVVSVKYTISRVVSDVPEGDVPVSRSGKAPMILMSLLLAADIFMETGIS